MSAVEQVQIPEKLFYRINEVSTLCQVKPYVLRYWESEFPMLSPEKDENEQRRYRRSDIELILEIKRLLYVEKFTIAGARKQLRQPAGKEQAAGPVAVESDVVAQLRPGRARELATSLSDLRRDVEELARLLA